MDKEIRRRFRLFVGWILYWVVCTGQVIYLFVEDR